MVLKDRIFLSFLQHPVFKEKYDISENAPQSLKQGLISDVPIVKAIAIIVDNLEAPSPATETEIYTTLTRFLNTASI